MPAKSTILIIDSYAKAVDDTNSNVKVIISSGFISDHFDESPEVSLVSITPNKGNNHYKCKGSKNRHQNKRG